MSAPTLNLSDINLNDPELFQREGFHEVLRVLRREAPVHWTPAGEVASWSSSPPPQRLASSRSSAAPTR